VLHTLAKLTWIFVALFVVTAIAVACGQEWTNLVGPPFGVRCIVYSVDSSEFIAGTSGGIYSATVGETTWQLRSLAGYQIENVVRPEGHPTKLYAATRQGLFSSGNDGFDWEEVTDFGIEGSVLYQDVDASPLNAGELCIAAGGPLGGFLYVSSDSGGTWQHHFPGLGGSTRLLECVFSRTNEDWLYVRHEKILFRFNMQDTLSIPIFSCEDLEEIASMTRNETSGQIAVLTNRRIAVYDDVLNQVSLLMGPDTLDTVYPTSIRYLDDDLFVGTVLGLYHVDPATNEWTSITEWSDECELDIVLDVDVPLLIATGYSISAGLQIRTWTSNLGEAFPAPAEFALAQNYPNPFNPETVIEFALPRAAETSLKVFDVLGREVATLVNAPMEVGVHRVTFDASLLASGVYFYRVEAGEFRAVRKMVVMR